MKNWSNNLKLGGGVAAVAALVGIGFLVWALGFRSSTDNKAAQSQKPGFATPAVEHQAFTFELKGSNGVRPSGVGSIAQVGASDVAFDLAGDVAIAGANYKPGASVSINLGSYPNTSGLKGGIVQAGTAPLTSLDEVGSIADSMFANATLGASKSFSFTSASPSMPVAGGSGISQLQTAAIEPLDAVGSVADSMFTNASLGASNSFAFSVAGANNAVPGGGGISQIRTAPLQSLDSVGSVADSMFSDAALGATSTFRFSAAGANSSVSGGSGISQLQTSTIAPLSSMSSAGEILMSQGTFEQRPLVAPATSAPNSTLQGLATRSPQSVSSTSAAAAGSVGVVFCGNLVNGACRPQYRTSMPHTQTKLLVGFGWSGVPVGTTVSLVYFDATTHKVVGKQTPVYKLPAASGGVILTSFKGPFPVLKLGVGALINGKPLRGAWVLNIV